MFESHGPSERGEGRIVQTVETVFLDNVSSEILKDIGQEQNVGEQIVIVILMKVFDVEKFPYILRTFVVCVSE